MNNPYKRSGADNMSSMLRHTYDRMFGGRSNVRCFNIFQFITMLNPLVTMRYYLFRRYGGMLYVADAILGLYAAIYLGIGRLIVHIVMMGLERHARKRKQRYFLKMVAATLDYLMM
jgi:hypothetical protein